ncbi:MAG: tetratricopeptide repeat protein [Treponema sp.]|nr:tetratricopeptide repeat protein [Treponema sp.]
MTDDAISEGVSLYKNKDFNGALTFFLSLPEDAEVDNIELAYYIGLCYAKLERYDDAMLYLEQVVTYSKNEKRILQCRYILAIVYSMTGKRKLALFELNKLIEIGYKPANAYASLAYIFWKENEVEKCLEAYKKSLQYDPENTTALNGMGYVLACENRDLTRALSYCKKALAHNTNSPACLDSVGWIYLKLGLVDDAFKYLYQARDLLPDNEEIAEHIRIAQEG